jgi:hypothetical protein
VTGLSERPDLHYLIRGPGGILRRYTVGEWKDIQERLRTQIIRKFFSRKFFPEDLEIFSKKITKNPERKNPEGAE